MAKSTSSNITKEQPKQVTAFARHLRIAPRKMRLVTNLVKNMYASDALVQLRYMNKKAAPMVAKAIQSAVANAQHNFSMNPEWLYIKSITTDQGKVMRRYFPRARGSAFVIRRKMCHVNVVLEEKKRTKVAAGRMSFLKKVQKPEAAASVDQKEATNIKPETKEPVKKTRTRKASEQVKGSTVQQKRRLFNRKSGE